jgi:hypothetical protein
MCNGRGTNGRGGGGGAFSTIHRHSALVQPSTKQHSIYKLQIHVLVFIFIVSLSYSHLISYPIAILLLALACHSHLFSHLRLAAFAYSTLVISLLLARVDGFANKHFSSHSGIADQTDQI